MNSSLSPCRETLRGICRGCGAVAVGFARAEAVAPDHAAAFRSMIADGRHGTMAYLERNVDMRLDPRLLLEGAATVVSMAFPYDVSAHHPLIASYALGLDYHRVLPVRLVPAVEYLNSFGGAARVCVDSAPVLERYWAVRSGVGYIARNHMLCVPGKGTGVFLAEIITSAEFEADSPCETSCEGCDRCMEVCPHGALRPDAAFDARRCVSYLTTEYRGDTFPEGLDTAGMVCGCDRCTRVCPVASVPDSPCPLDEFRPLRPILGLSREDLSVITRGQFRNLFENTAISRLNPRQIKRNSILT